MSRSNRDDGLGAIYTPAWLVRRVVRRTLAPLLRGRGPAELLRLRVLDPACGDGAFLLGVAEELARAIARGADQGIRRRIVSRCLFGVDIDDQALEQARRALIEWCGAPRSKALVTALGRNLQHGNSLVGPDAHRTGLSPELCRALVPFDWARPGPGPGQVMRAGGFDAVVGNPPYLEPKRYCRSFPGLDHYLKLSGHYCTTSRGKVDLSLPFLERGVALLRTGGRLGYVMQSRFFKTDYGGPARAWLAEERLLSEIEEYQGQALFPGRITYPAVLILSERNRHLRYSAIGPEPGCRPSSCRVPLASLDERPWSFDQPDLFVVQRALAARHGTIGDHAAMQVSVGLQVSCRRLFLLEEVSRAGALLSARNGDGLEVCLERDALRPVCRNRLFYPLRRQLVDAWVLFPYDVRDRVAREIRWPEFQDRFPRAAAYLSANRRQLTRAVAVPPGPGRWHLYRYPKNLVEQARPKLLFPSTIEDTVAAVDSTGDVYQDNVRVNSLSISDGSVDLRAVAAVFNSTVFSALARLTAGRSDGSWRQLNRQYALLVPFPLQTLRQPDRARRLVAAVELLQELQETILRRGHDAETRLEQAWLELDELVAETYGLSRDEKRVLGRYPRLVSRAALLKRAAGSALCDQSLP